MPYNLQAAKRAIRAECTARGLDDDARRAMMQAVAGVSSSTQLDADGARKVLDHLRGHLVPAARASRTAGEWEWVNRAVPARRPLLWKLRRQCMIGGILEGSQVRYCEGVAAQMAGGVTKPLRMCDRPELHKIVQAMEIHVGRSRA